MDSRDTEEEEQKENRCLFERLDFEEQVKAAEIQLKEDKKPNMYAEHSTTTLEEEEDEKEHVRELNKGSSIFNSKQRLTNLESSGRTQTSSLSRGPQKNWLHNSHNDMSKWQVKRSSVDDDNLPSTSASMLETSNCSLSMGRSSVKDTIGRSPAQISKSKAECELTNKITSTIPDTEYHGGYGRGRGVGVCKRPVFLPETFVGTKKANDAIKENALSAEHTNNESTDVNRPTFVTQNQRLKTVDSKEQSIEIYKNEKITELIDRFDPRVTYGCISIVGGIPGRTLVRGSMLMSPLANISKFVYYSEMKQGLLNAAIEELNVLQKSVAPHLLRGDDCFIIGGRKCGKSLSYLIPVVGSLVHECRLQNLHKDPKQTVRAEAERLLQTKGPRCIIICSEFKSALKIEGHLFNLVANRLVVALVCDDMKETMAKCRVEIDIMVTTLAFASSMLQRCHSHFKFDRLQYLVFDDVDIIMRSSPEQFDKIRIAAETFVLKNPHRQPYQRVFCGHEWSDEMEELYFKVPGFPDPNVPVFPTVHIQSSNQAIRYSKMKWHMHEVDEEEKIDKIVRLLKSGGEAVQHKNVFIVCSTPELVFEVHTELDKQGIQTCMAEMETMSTDDVIQLTQRWENFPVTRRVMVLHDAILRDLRIYNVTYLIHYDLPQKSPLIKSSMGAARFSCMWGFFRDISEEKKNPSAAHQRQELVSHFLLTGMEKQLYKLKTFALKMGAKMPESLAKTADEIGNLELEKKPMCLGMILHGKCFEAVLDDCLARHKFRLDELEESPTMPRSGEIEVNVTNCLNPSYYTVKVLRYYELKDGGKFLKHNFINVFNERTKKLNDYYAVEENKVQPQSFETGTYCGVNVSLVGFTRAKIERVVTRTEMKFPKMIKVFCLDHGEYLQPRAEDIFALPAGYEELTNLSVNIVLANLRPLDGSYEYRLHEINKAQQLTMGKILLGKIRLSVGDTVWINPLLEMHKDPSTQKSVKGKSIRMELINRRCAENNDWHIENLVEICKSVGFTCKEFQKEEQHLLSDNDLMSTFFRLGDEVRWAYVPSATIDEPTSVEIWTTFVKDPYSIFGTNDKFDLQLYALVSDLNKAVIEMIADKCKEYATQFELLYETGLVVAVKDRKSNEKGWVRGIITKKYESEGLFDVFLVDVGDQELKTSMKDIFPMPYDLVTRLPFQVVAFELAHIKPLNSSDPQLWDEKAIDGLINLTLDENGDGRKISVVAQPGKNNHISGCRQYAAILLMDNGEEIGASLVDQNVAGFVGNAQERIDSVKGLILAKYNQMYDNREGATDDEEEDEAPNLDVPGWLDDDNLDRWDFHCTDASTVLKQMGYELPDSNSAVRPVPESSSSENSKMLLQVADEMSESTLSGPEKSSSSAQINYQAAALNLPLFSDLLHPKVFWRQTQNQFILVVSHPDIRSYSLDIEGRKVSLRINEPPGYGFDLVCYGRLESKADEFLTGQYLRIKLNKRVKNWKWPKPLEEDVKNMWFKEDPDDAHSSADEEEESEEKKIPGIPTVFKKSEDSDDFDSSDGDDPEQIDIGAGIN